MCADLLIDVRNVCRFRVPAKAKGMQNAGTYAATPVTDKTEEAIKVLKKTTPSVDLFVVGVEYHLAGPRRTDDVAGNSWVADSSRSRGACGICRGTHRRVVIVK